MSDLLSNLGINWKILLAQIVNFAVLLFILTKFLYRPILKILSDRREEIQKATLQRENIAKQLKDLEGTKEEVLAETRSASTELIKKAEVNALAAGERILAETKESVARMSAEERRRLAAEREKIRQELTNEIGEVVVAAVEKTVGDVLDKRERDQLVEQALSIVRSHHIKT